MRASPRTRTTTPLVAYLDQSYVINLVDRSDRREALVPRLASIGWHVAPDGPIAFFPAIRPAQAGHFGSIGVRGCYESHLAVWKLALARGATSVLVMEDDMVPLPLLKQHEAAIVAQLRATPDWAMCYLGYAGDAEKEQARKVDPALPLRASHTPMFRAHCYAINGWLLPELIAHVEAFAARPAHHPEGGAMHLDAALWWFRQARPERKVLLASRIMATQAASRSDIHRGRWDSTPVVRRLLPRARAVKNWIATR